MQQLLDDTSKITEVPNTFVDQTEPSASSLAEAIALTNISLAYDLVESRPMVALAEAAAEFINVLRLRHGETVIDRPVSELLAELTARYNEVQIGAAINALNSALDGTSVDETTAVQMAILRAINALES